VGGKDCAADVAPDRKLITRNIQKSFLIVSPCLRISVVTGYFPHT
jgi:hypothetical protein